MQMRKSALAVSAALLLAATAQVAQAGNVRIVGFYDTSIQVTHTKGQGTTTEMAPDQVYSTGFHLVANEDLGNGYGVETKLFVVASADTGELASNDGALMNHSLLIFKTPYGNVGAGRMAAFAAGCGPIGNGWKTDPFVAGYYDAGAQGTMPGVYGEILKNTIYYESPEFSGYKLGLLYSLTGESNKEGQQNANDTKFWEVYGQYKGSSLFGFVDFQGFHYGDDSALNHLDDTLRFRASFAWTMDPTFTLYGGYGFGRNEVKYTTSAWGNRPDFTLDAANPLKQGTNGRALDMHSFYVGAKKSTGAWDWLGQFQGQIGQNKGLMTDGEKDFRHWIAAVGANYNFSRRTMAYSALSYGWVDKAWRHDEGAKKLERSAVMLGIATVF